MGNLLLHLIEHILCDNSIVRIFYTEPFFLRLADSLFVLVGNIRLFAVNAVAYVSFILEDTLDLCNRPCVGFFLRCIGLDIGKRAVSGIVQPS